MPPDQGAANDSHDDSRGYRCRRYRCRNEGGRSRRAGLGAVRTAREAQAALAMSSFDQRKAALHAAAGLIANIAEILARNEADVARAGPTASARLIDRLTLTPARIEGMAAGLDQITGLEDPIGRELARWSRPNGLDIACRDTSWRDRRDI